MGSLLQTCALLERRVKAAAQDGKTVFHPELRQIRTELRQACEGALFEDYPRAQRHDLEQLLWKSVFYRPIAEFRKRIKEHAQQRNEGMLSKTRTAFHLYLEEGRQFYTLLAVKLQAALGDVGYDPGQEWREQAQQAAQQAQQLGLQGRYDCRVSVYRCLICLGDLARYQASNAESQQRDWSQCKLYYLQAARVYPQGGNSYNQLAVLATYEQDELGAAFYYLRALSVPSPFAVARENLVTALDANRSSYAKLVASPAGGGGGSWRSAAGPLPQRGTRPTPQLERELRIRWVRVLGILHLKLDLDAFPDFLAAALADLDDYLPRLRKQPWQAKAGTGGGAKVAPALEAPAANGSSAALDSQDSRDVAGPPSMLLQLAMCLMCVAHSALAEHAQLAQQQQGASGSFLESLQGSVVRGHALTAVVEVAARLAGAACSACKAASAAGAAAQQDDRFCSSSNSSRDSALHQQLPPLWFLLRWMARPLPASALSAQALVPAQRVAAAAQHGQQQSPDLLAAALKRFGTAALQLMPALRQLEQEPGTARTPPKPSGTAALGSAAEGREPDSTNVLPALPEDLHCCCFEPFGATASSSGDPADGLAPVAEHLNLRAQRVLLAAQELASELLQAQQQQQQQQQGIASSASLTGPLAAFLAAASSVGTHGEVPPLVAGHQEVNASALAARRRQPEDTAENGQENRPAAQAAQQAAQQGSKHARQAALVEQQQQAQQRAATANGALEAMDVDGGVGYDGMEEDEEVFVYNPAALGMRPSHRPPLPLPTTPAATSGPPAATHALTTAPAARAAPTLATPAAAPQPGPRPTASHSLAAAPAAAPSSAPPPTQHSPREAAVPAAVPAAAAPVAGFPSAGGGQHAAVPPVQTAGVQPVPSAAAGLPGMLPPSGSTFATGPPAPPQPSLCSPAAPPTGAAAGAPAGAAPAAAPGGTAVPRSVLHAGRNPTASSQQGGSRAGLTASQLQPWGRPAAAVEWNISKQQLDARVPAAAGEALAVQQQLQLQQQQQHTRQEGREPQPLQQPAPSWQQQQANQQQQRQQQLSRLQQAAIPSAMDVVQGSRSPAATQPTYQSTAAGAAEAAPQDIPVLPGAALLQQPATGRAAGEVLHQSSETERMRGVPGGASTPAVPAEPGASLYYSLFGAGGAHAQQPAQQSAQQPARQQLPQQQFQQQQQQQQQWWERHLSPSTVAHEQPQHSMAQQAAQGDARPAEGAVAALPPQLSMQIQQQQQQLQQQIDQGAQAQDEKQQQRGGVGEGEAAAGPALPQLGASPQHSPPPPQQVAHGLRAFLFGTRQGSGGYSALAAHQAQLDQQQQAQQAGRVSPLLAGQQAQLSQQLQQAQQAGRVSPLLADHQAQLNQQLQQAQQAGRVSAQLAGQQAQLNQQQQQAQEAGRVSPMLWGQQAQQGQQQQALQAQLTGRFSPSLLGQQRGQQQQGGVYSPALGLAPAAGIQAGGLGQFTSAAMPGGQQTYPAAGLYGQQAQHGQGIYAWQAQQVQQLQGLSAQLAQQAQHSQGLDPQQLDVLRALALGQQYWQPGGPSPQQAQQHWPQQAQQAQEQQQAQQQQQTFAALAAARASASAPLGDSNSLFGQWAQLGRGNTSYQPGPSPGVAAGAATLPAAPSGTGKPYGTGMAGLPAAAPPPPGFDPGHAPPAVAGHAGGYMASTPLQSPYAQASALYGAMVSAYGPQAPSGQPAGAAAGQLLPAMQQPHFQLASFAVASELAGRGMGAATGPSTYGGAGAFGGSGGGGGNPATAGPDAPLGTLGSGAGAALGTYGSGAGAALGAYGSGAGAALGTLGSGSIPGTGGGWQ